ncbi:hypothetical protein ACU8DI_05240 [Psychroserpens sp. BH13MA-6]
MKNLVTLFLGIILGAAAMYYFCANYNEEDMVDSMVPRNPKGYIDAGQISALTQAYNPRYDLISDSIFPNTEFGDNRSSWYALQDVRDYLTIAENQADSLGYVMTGVRIYPGAYPDSKGVPGYSTYLFVPTGYKNTSQGNVLHMSFQGNNDIPNGGGLNKGGSGEPPSANYPQ